MVASRNYRSAPPGSDSQVVDYDYDTLVNSLNKIGYDVNNLGDQELDDLLNTLTSARVPLRDAPDVLRQLVPKTMPGTDRPTDGPDINSLIQMTLAGRE